MYRTCLLYVAIAGKIGLANPAAAQVPIESRPKLSLNEAISRAIEQSKALRSNAAAQGIAEARLQQARNQYAPSIVANASYIRISDNIRPFAVTLPGAGEVVLNPQILNQSYNNLQVRQLLWGGGKVRNGILAGLREVEATRLEATQNRLQAADQAMSLWFNLLLLQTSEQIIRQNIRLLQDRRWDLENLQQQGIVLKNDGLKVDLAISNLQASLVDLETGRSINRFNLATAMGYPTETEFAIDTAEVSLPQTVPPLPQWIQEALQTRTEAKALNLRREAALLGGRIIQSNRLPTLGWGGSYDYNRPNQRVFPNRPAFTGTWQVGVFLSFDISGLVANKAKETESRFGIERLNTALDGVNDGIRMEVNAAYQTYAQARQKIDLAQIALGQASENFRVEQNRLRAGATTPTDFLEANTQLLQAELNLRSAITAAQLAERKLQMGTGKLTNTF